MADLRWRRKMIKNEIWRKSLVPWVFKDAEYESVQIGNIQNGGSKMADGTIKIAWVCAEIRSKGFSNSLITNLKSDLRILLYKIEDGWQCIGFERKFFQCYAKFYTFPAAILKILMKINFFQIHRFEAHIKIVRLSMKTGRFEWSNDLKKLLFWKNYLRNWSKFSF